MRRAAARRRGRSTASRRRRPSGSRSSSTVPGRDQEHDRRHARRLHAGPGADDVARGGDGRAARRTSGPRRRTATGDDLPRYPGHLFADADGHVPGRPQRLGAHGRRGRARPARLRRLVPEPGERDAGLAADRLPERRGRVGVAPARLHRRVATRRRHARPRRSSTRTATTWPMPGPSSGPSPTSPSSPPTGSSASSRWPRWTMGACGCSTSPIRQCGPRCWRSRVAR